MLQAISCMQGSCNAANFQPQLDDDPHKFCGESTREFYARLFDGSRQEGYVCHARMVLLHLTIKMMCANVAMS